MCHAAQHYGVRAHGVTLAAEQFAFAQAKIARLGLADRVTLELKDYTGVSGRFDKIASIGMFEQVGIRNHPTYFRAIYRLLKPGGLYLHHTIARPNDQAFERRPPAYAAIVRYIFPGGEVDHLGMSIANLERYGFEVHDVEAWREHYARTTRLWHDRLLAERAAAEREVGPVKTRLWLAYLAGCSTFFANNEVGIFQTLASKRAKGASGLPPTRGSPLSSHIEPIVVGWLCEEGTSRVSPFAASAKLLPCDFTSCGWCRRRRGGPRLLSHRRSEGAPTVNGSTRQCLCPGHKSLRWCMSNASEALGGDVVEVRRRRPASRSSTWRSRAVWGWVVFSATVIGLFSMRYILAQAADVPGGNEEPFPSSPGDHLSCSHGLARRDGGPLAAVARLAGSTSWSASVAWPDLSRRRAGCLPVRFASRADGDHRIPGGFCVCDSRHRVGAGHAALGFLAILRRDIRGAPPMDASKLRDGFRGCDHSLLLSSSESSWNTVCVHLPGEPLAVAGHQLGHGRAVAALACSGCGDLSAAARRKKQRRLVPTI